MEIRVHADERLSALGEGLREGQGDECDNAPLLP